MNYHTVDSLILKLYELHKQGLGNKYIIVSSDDEGNDYRCLPAQEVLTKEEDIARYVDPDYHRVYVDLKDCILL